MISCSRVQSTGRRASCAPAGIGYLPVPDPRTWPAEARERFHQLTGDSGPLDVFIFVSGAFAAMYLADAVTMAGLVEIDPREWHTEAAYPGFQFDSERVGVYADTLTAAGYVVHVLEPTEQIREQFAGSTQRAEVVNIADARCKRRSL